MKRFFFIATMAIMAIGCQKTEVQNEVFKPIGFNTEVGKQTRAIVTGEDYLDPQNPQPFAVYAYGHQPKDQSITETTVMDNVEIGYTAATTKWAATGGTKYYWPNDPNTTLNFYAYSPAYGCDNAPENHSPAGHQVLTFAQAKENKPASGISHSEENGLTLTNYLHDNMYVDFMVATPVIDARFSETDKYDLTTFAEGNGVVPVVFNHQMTQVVFNVTTDLVYPGVKFTVNYIKLKNIFDQADYNNRTVKTSVFAHGTWTNWTGSSTYDIFPADTDNGAVSTNAKVENNQTLEAPLVIDYITSTPETQAVVTTTGVTMIPQNMIKATKAPVAGKDTYANTTGYQMFEIQYEIEGTGVANETVTKHVPFFAYDEDVQAAVNWAPNQRIVYTVKLGLQEITFTPSVNVWDPQSPKGEIYNFAQ